METAQDDWIVMGRIGAPFGVQGWVRVQTFSTDPDTLLDFAHWWLRTGVPAAVRGPRRVDGPGPWREIEVLEAQAHGGGLIALLAGVDDRDQAARLRGSEVGLLRGELPPPGEGEYYWSDLIGLTAIDPAGSRLGVVSALLEAGAQDVLVIDTLPAGAGGGQAGEAPAGRSARGGAGKVRQILVPFVERHVGAVDLKAKTVVVDWEEPV